MPPEPSIVLAMLAMDDVAAHLAGEDDELVRWLNGGPGTLESVTAHLQRCVEQWQRGGPIFAFGIHTGDSEVLAGTVEVQFDQPYLQPDQVNLSYGLYPAWRGRGLGSRAVELACEFAIARGAREAVIRTEPANHASAALARRCGFSYIRASDDSGDGLEWWVRDLVPADTIPLGLQVKDLVLLVGPPGVGKSTLTQRLLADGRIEQGGVVSADILKNEMFPRVADSDVRDPAVFAEVDRRVRNRLTAGRPVIVDATNVRVAARSRLIAIARQLDRSVTAIRFTADVPIALVRNAARDARLPDAVVREYADLMRAQGTRDQLVADGVDIILDIM